MSTENVEVLQHMIHRLKGAMDCELPDIMNELKAALKANESASVLLLPEDIGEMVKALKRMNGEVVSAKTTKKTKAPSKSKSTSKAALAELATKSTKELLAVLDDL